MEGPLGNYFKTISRPVFFRFEGLHLQKPLNFAISHFTIKVKLGNSKDFVSPDHFATLSTFAAFDENAILRKLVSNYKMIA